MGEFGVVERRAKVSQLDPIELATYDSRTVMYWSQSAKECLGSQRSKAKKLLDYDCVKYAGLNEFVVLPLNMEERVEFGGRVWIKKPYPINYNRKLKPYVLVRDGDSFKCCCQWSVKTGQVCAHVLALMLAFKLKRFGQGVVVGSGSEAI